MGVSLNEIITEIRFSSFFVHVTFGVTFSTKTCNLRITDTPNLTFASLFSRKGAVDSSIPKGNPSPLRHPTSVGPVPQSWRAKTRGETAIDPSLGLLQRGGKPAVKEFPPNCFTRDCSEGDCKTPTRNSKISYLRLLDWKTKYLNSTTRGWGMVFHKGNHFNLKIYLD